MLLRFRGRIFAVCVGTCLVVSLPPELAAALARAGVALRLDPGPDSLLRGWVVLTPGASGTHLLLAREACEHARRQATPPVQVDDVDAATESAGRLGATILRPKTSGPAGEFSVIADPAGARIALWQPAAT